MRAQKCTLQEENKNIVHWNKKVDHNCKEGNLQKKVPKWMLSLKIMVPKKRATRKTRKSRPKTKPLKNGRKWKRKCFKNKKFDKKVDLEEPNLKKKWESQKKTIQKKGTHGLLIPYFHIGEKGFKKKRKSSKKRGAKYTPKK